VTGPDIHQQITDALAGRRAQKSSVADLASRWHTLRRTFETMMRAVEAADRSLSDGADLLRDVELNGGFDPVLRRPGKDGRQPADLLRAQLDEVGQQIETVCARLSRETVNIGVIGGTKVGKSTLLRTITQLSDSVIPSTRFEPTTASASRIYHTDGKPQATLTLHTWESFRDLYLAPLHELAGLGPVPQTPAAFRDERYPRPRDKGAPDAKADDFLRKLAMAQRSFGSYVELLTGPARSMTVAFEKLRPYVAYPDRQNGDSLDVQPFHAVRSVQIDQNFPEGAATKLGLIDLPGAGEAGLDIDRQFLQQVKNEIDLLMMVKRPSHKAGYLAEDGYTRNLADSARAGVPLDDYYVVVVNRDAEHDESGAYFENAVRSVEEVARERNIRVLTTDVIDQTDVFANLVRPVLDHLAKRLAEMDRIAVRKALVLAAKASAAVAAFAGDIVSLTDGWVHALPDRRRLFRDAAEELRNGIADELAALLDRYDEQVSAGSADSALSSAISEAVSQARAWVAAGLGRGGRDQWVAALRGRFVAGSLKAKQEEYFRPKTEITKIFSRIDVSLDLSARQLWDDIATVLRDKLTEELVPHGDDALDELRQTANARRAFILRDALEQVRRLKVDYGSVVLRVTRPIIREIDWDHPSAETAAPPPPAPAPVAPPPAAPASTATYQWVTGPGGDRRRVLVAGPDPIVPAQPQTRATVPAASHGHVGYAKSGVDALYDELITTVERCVAKLEAALSQEAEVMSRTLAAAADRFLDAAIRTNGSDIDFEYLCEPDQRTIWSDKLDAGSARLSADLSRAQEDGRQVVQAATEVTQLVAGNAADDRL